MAGQDSSSGFGRPLNTAVSNLSLTSSPDIATIQINYPNNNARLHHSHHLIPNVVLALLWEVDFPKIRSLAWSSGLRIPRLR